MPKPNVFVRNPFNYDVDEVSRETGLRCLAKSLTVQSQAEEADINVIVKRFGITGRLPDPVSIPSFGDFEGVSDFRSALHITMDAEAAFMKMPAGLRKRFANDPAIFLDFFNDPSNLDEAVKLGLVVQPEVKKNVDGSPN